MSKSKVKPDLPVLGSVLAPHEWRALQSNRALTDDSERWHNWVVYELGKELQAVALEEMIDDAMQPEENVLPEDEVVFTMFPVEYELDGHFESLPPEVRRFIRNLEKLVNQTHKEISGKPKKEDS